MIVNLPNTEPTGMSKRRIGWLSFLCGLLIVAAVPLSGQGPFTAQIEMFWQLISAGGRAFTNLAVATSGYVSFGSTLGASGYGFRDSGGVPQVKSSGGAWEAIATASSAVWVRTGTVLSPATATDQVALNMGAMVPLTRFGVVETTNVEPRGIASYQISTDTVSSREGLFKARGVPGGLLTIVSGDVIGRVNGWGYDGTSWLNMASLRMASTGTIGTGRIPTAVSIWTGTDAATSVLTQAVSFGPDQVATFTDAITMGNGKALRTDVTAGHTFTLAGYTSAAYANLLTVTNAATPTITIPVISGATTFPAAITHGGALALGTTSTDGIVLQNTTAALVGTTVQITPRVQWAGTGWDADDAVSRPVRFFAEALPVSANTVTGTWKLGFLDPITNAITYPVTVTSAGALSTTSGVSANGTVAGSNLVANAGGEISWSGRSKMLSSGSGLINLTNGTTFTRLTLGLETASFSGISFRAANGLEILSGAGASTWNDASTAGSGTLGDRMLFSFATQPTLTATNASVTYTRASTVYIANAPTASTNVTISNAYALYVAAGNARFLGDVYGATFSAPGGAGVDCTSAANVTVSKGIVTACTAPVATPESLLAQIHELQAAVAALQSQSGKQ
jgi:hypothetical protein